VTRAEWRSVAPIQRVLAEHPLVNPVQRFSSTLASWQSPGYLEPLGHRVGPAEPAGFIGDLVRPAMPVLPQAAGHQDGPARPGAPVQRVAAPAEEPGDLPLVLPVVAGREVVPPLMSAGGAVTPPVRTLQAIASPVDTPAAEVRPVAAPEPAAPEPVAAEPARPELPLVQRTEQAVPRRLGLGAPMLPDASPSLPVSRLADDSPGSASPANPPPPGSPPVNSFRPLDTPEIRSGTTEPPGTPGGSTSVSTPLPVARAVEDSSAPAGSSALPVTRVGEEPPLPGTGGGEVPALPVASTAPEPPLPVSRAA
jgi:hypothetical protein